MRTNNAQLFYDKPSARCFGEFIYPVDKHDRSTMIDIKDNLQRISNILQNHPGDSAEWVASLQTLYDQDTSEFYKQLNSKRMWGGACSIANQALADNPGMDEWSWKCKYVNCVS